MAYRNKTYIAFDGDKDMHYYRLMTAWSAHEGFDFDIYNAHDLNTARDSTPACWCVSPPLPTLIFFIAMLIFLSMTMDKIPTCL